MSIFLLTSSFVSPKYSLLSVELSPKIREANKKTFGRDMTAAELVRQIVGDVRREGDAAVIRYTHLIDRVDYKPEDFLVTEAEYEAVPRGPLTPPSSNRCARPPRMCAATIRSRSRTRG